MSTPQVRGVSNAPEAYCDSRTNHRRPCKGIVAGDSRLSVPQRGVVDTNNAAIHNRAAPPPRGSANKVAWPGLARGALPPARSVGVSVARLRLLPPPSARPSGRPPLAAPAPPPRLRALLRQ